MTIKEQLKSTGATFTPTQLADLLAERMHGYLRSSMQQVLDPACGDGELLLAIGKQLTLSGIDFALTGYDNHEKYLRLANERLLPMGIRTIKLVHADFLEAIDISRKQAELLFNTEIKSPVNSFFDIVIANPPYVRTQILGGDKAQYLSKKFNLTGRIDLYYPFLIAMTESLKDGGLLGVITSNRYLSTKSGESVRKFLSENYEILEVIDLGDTKLFDAAVLPAIFIGRKTKTKKIQGARFTKIYENLNGFDGQYTCVEGVYDALKSEESGYFKSAERQYKKSIGILKSEVGSSVPWEMLSSSESDWVSKINHVAKYKVADFFKVRVGIKTTADKVFIREDWDTLKNKPESNLLKPLISQENIVSWSATENSKLKVLYPHYSDNGVKKTINLDKYPKAAAYFEEHQQTLKGRKYVIEAGRQWFEIWVPHRPDLWERPKLIFPDISSTPRFYFDLDKKLVNGNCYWIVAEVESDIDRLLLIQGVANSKLMTKYHDLVFNNKLYSGRRRYFTQYVEKYPLPDVHSEAAKRIVDIVKKLNNTDQTILMRKLEHELEIEIAIAFDVPPVLILD